MPDLPAVGSSAVERYWQIMNGLHIASRVEAIEFLRAEDCLPRLSIEEIRCLLEMFPLMPADQGGGNELCVAGRAVRHRYGPGPGGDDEFDRH